mmetsp:Transcript_18649/g.25722  ORF Transcript_18649/g.25722 Transcript_18649/m.25722 type:complete len:231 (-) Transcript_18649:321-1013(-)
MTLKKAQRKQCLHMHKILQNEIEIKEKVKYFCFLSSVVSFLERTIISISFQTRPAEDSPTAGSPFSYVCCEEPPLCGDRGASAVRAPSRVAEHHGAAASVFRGAGSLGAAASVIRGAGSPGAVAGSAAPPPASGPAPGGSAAAAPCGPAPRADCPSPAPGEAPTGRAPTASSPGSRRCGRSRPARPSAAAAPPPAPPSPRCLRGCCRRCPPLRSPWRGASRGSGRFLGAG